MVDTGIVTKRTKGFYYLLDENGEMVECKVKGQLFKSSRYDNQIAVGDRVSFSRSDADDIGLISGIKERQSFLSRSRVGIEAEQIIAANVDNLLVVAATKKPPFRTNFVNRILVAANVGNIKPVLVLTKTDLVSKQEIADLLEPYRNIELDIIESSTKSEASDSELKTLLVGKVSVLAGQSGVGKSSLLNKLFPGLDIKVGAVSHKTSKGSHTTTYAIMHQVVKNTFVIDTPGIREFGLWGINRDNLGENYPGLSAFNHQCKHRDCHHIHEPDCAVKDAVESGSIHKSLFSGYQSIYHSLAN
ncbi:MAG: ribosome small subunit-dependent GTPase A [Proteobacteria bacterium]|nr:ribosome small subunit-dependent GTPase A [Pseudomonadota bacterium]